MILPQAHFFSKNKPCSVGAVICCQFFIDFRVPPTTLWYMILSQHFLFSQKAYNIGILVAIGAGGSQVHGLGELAATVGGTARPGPPEGLTY